MSWTKAVSQPGDPPRGFGDLRFIDCQRDPQVACAALAEALARHGDNLLLIEKPHREIVAREPCPPHIDHYEHAAFRHMRGSVPCAVQPIEKRTGAVLI